VASSAPATRTAAAAAVNSSSSKLQQQQQQQQQQQAHDTSTDAHTDVYSGDSAEEYDAAVETCNRRTGWESNGSNSNSSNSKLQSTELAAVKLQALADRAAVAAARQLNDRCTYAAAVECTLTGNAAEQDEYEVTELAEDSMVSLLNVYTIYCTCICVIA
jgi:hypothetical protein